MIAMLIRDVPDEIIASVDAHASRLGLSRSEYVRRRLAQDAAATESPVIVTDLAGFAGTFGTSPTLTSCPRRGDDRVARRQVRARPAGR